MILGFCSLQLRVDARHAHQLDQRAMLLLQCNVYRSLATAES
jgi:hypothetical protein